MTEGSGGKVWPFSPLWSVEEWEPFVASRRTNLRITPAKGTPDRENGFHFEGRGIGTPGSFGVRKCCLSSRPVSHGDHCRGTFDLQAVDIPP